MSKTIKNILQIISLLIVSTAGIFTIIKGFESSTSGPDVNIYVEEVQYETPKILYQRFLNFIDKSTESKSLSTNLDSVSFIISATEKSILSELQLRENSKSGEIINRNLTDLKYDLSEFMFDYNPYDRLERDTLVWLMKYDYLALVRIFNKKDLPLENLQFNIRGKKEKLNFYFEVLENRDIKYQGFFEEYFKIPYLNLDYHPVLIWSDSRLDGITVSYNGELIPVIEIVKSSGFIGWLQKNKLNIFISITWTIIMVALIYFLFSPDSIFRSFIKKE